MDTGSLHPSPETITALLVGYTPVQNAFAVKKLKKKKESKIINNLIPQRWCQMLTFRNISFWKSTPDICKRYYIIYLVWHQAYLKKNNNSVLCFPTPSVFQGHNYFLLFAFLFLDHQTYTSL